MYILQEIPSPQSRTAAPATGNILTRTRERIPTWAPLPDDDPAFLRPSKHRASRADRAPAGVDSRTLAGARSSGDDDYFNPSFMAARRRRTATHRTPASSPPKPNIEARDTLCASLATPRDAARASPSHRPWREHAACTNSAGEDPSEAAHVRRPWRRSATATNGIPDRGNQQQQHGEKSLPRRDSGGERQKRAAPGGGVMEEEQERVESNKETTHASDSPATTVKAEDDDAVKEEKRNPPPLLATSSCDTARAGPQRTRRVAGETVQTPPATSCFVVLVLGWTSEQAAFSQLIKRIERSGEEESAIDSSSSCRRDPRSPHL
nr:unnamed protein product [Digitaria exilis]CAB3498871.1 unnamed protein product [Digitaria exilis]